MLKHPKKLSDELLHENNWFKYKHDTFQLANKRNGDYFYLETKGSVIMVPLLDDGRIVMVMQYRYLEDKESIELPCGAIEAEETAQAAAERELLEETGFKAHEFIKIGVFNPCNGLLKENSHVFWANQLEQLHAPQNDLTENIELVYRRPDEIDQMIRHGEIWDGQTLAAWALVHHHLLHK